MATKMLGSLGRDARANRMILGLLVVGFIALLAAAVAVFWIQRDNEANAALVSHTLAVEARLGTFASANERLETARRGLLLTGNPAFQGIMREAEASARRHLADLTALTRDMMINVTAFFRDPPAWEALDRDVIAPIVAKSKLTSAARAPIRAATAAASHPAWPPPTTITSNSRIACR